MERREEVPPYLTGQLRAGVSEKNPRTFAYGVPLSNLIVFMPVACVHRRLPRARHQQGSNFDREGGC